ncbi:MAG: DJ-1/PfpI family protein [Oligosphaeraceae bacterium]|nr:DJ-1/PfpI family protein [Oligosphaeraceae bacterium]
MTKVAVLLAPGFEEIEAVSVVDILRRAGVEVLLAGVDPDDQGGVQGAHGLTLLTDCLLEDLNVDDLAMAVYPGGMPGASNLAASDGARLLAQAVCEKGGWAAAICAAPVVLAAAGLLKGVEYTCYPSFEKKISAGKYTGARVQVCGKIITACGPGAAADFAFALLRALGLEKEAQKLHRDMLIA